MVDQPTNQPAKEQMAVVAAQQLAPQFNEMLEGGCSTWSFVSHPGPTTKTRQPSPTKALYSARAFTGERQKLGDGGVVAPSLKGLGGGGRLMLRGFVVLFILLGSTILSISSSSRSSSSSIS